MHKYSPTEDYLTAPVSLGLRLGQPAIATPATEHVPFWRGKPEVPAPPAKHRQPRRPFSLFVRDEAASVGIVAAAILGISYEIAAYLS